MKSSAEARPSTPGSRVLLVLLVIVSVAFAWILLPFYGTLMWGAIIALLFSPVYRWPLIRLKQRRTLAALLTLLIVLLIAILPIALISASLTREVTLICKRPAAPPIVFSRGSAIFLLFGRENDGEKTRASVLAKAS